MSIDVAKNAIIDAFNDDSFDEVEIDFFGGEPFAEFKNIELICEWIWQNKWSKPYIVFATTNGTLVHGKIRDWIYKNSHRFVLGISIDGTQDMHNLNRNNSFNKIDLDFFSQLWPFQPVKMTLSRLTISNLADGIVYLHNRGFKVACNNAHGITWENEDYPVFAEQLKKLSDYYVANPDIEPSSIIIMPIQMLSFGNSISKWCGAGTNMICINKSGTKYPCHTFMPSTSGNDINLSEILNKLNSDKLLDSHCQGCVLTPCCPTCYGMNYVENSDIIKRNKSHCIFSKIRAKATAYMLSQMLTNKERGYVYMKDKTDKDISNIIHGIRTVNESVQI